VVYFLSSLVGFSGYMHLFSFRKFIVTFKIGILSMTSHKRRNLFRSCQKRGVGGLAGEGGLLVNGTFS